MPHFSIRSKANLATCHIDLRNLFNNVIAVYDCTAICGHRDEATQNKAFDDGVSTLRWPDSKHNKKPSLAVDVTPYPLNWEDKPAFYYFAGQVREIGRRMFESGNITHQIRWGGDWDGDGDLHDQKLYDLVHFELIGAE